jgi:hypothetical protein
MELKTESGVVRLRRNNHLFTDRRLENDYVITDMVKNNNVFTDKG